ncbi:c-type cytochrome biogenesis protein CcmI [Echinimonas agarilytica]|uniref:C-type cytochrome biogenesis protein CcmI n=1 Tax=Echinimonas agarilytica TaxID=1215918 RepID=A0AA41W515_9GAMM|nr:c-type cytochrome biogenesis protein CcmI [Echinimonas agarilytica]MCM2679006.1 c-type cytochrome biogenesis protein CcmI [Echinimonas agarilytica]
MMVFWIGALVLLALALVPFLFNASKPKVGENNTQLALNKRIFNQRLAELQKQKDSGDISEADFEQLNAELQAGLLDDTETMDVPASEQDGSMRPIWALSAVIFAAAIALYVGMGNYQKVENWQTAMTNMPQLAEKLMGPDAANMSQEELEQFALALRTKLKENGDDAMGWLLFGRIQMSFGRINEATEAFVEALHLAPDNKAANLSYAKALAMTGDEGKMAYAQSVYKRLLKQSPEDLDILSEQAFTLFEMGDQQGAFASWQRMLEILPSDHPRHAQITRTLAMIKGSAAGDGPHGTVAHPAAEAAPPEPVAKEQGVADALSVTVTVDVAPGVDLPDNAFLVVFARAVSGPPMPMAVKRMELPALPVSITLSQSDAMMENYQLGTVEPFEIVAKVAMSANVATAQSELESVSKGLTKADLPTSVNLTLRTPQ